MKRLLILLCVAGLLAAIPLSHVAAAKKPEKVAICHINSANDVVVLDDGTVITYGRVIEVSEKAIEAHEAHGDSTEFSTISKKEREADEEEYGVRLTNANCRIEVNEEPGPE